MKTYKVTVKHDTGKATFTVSVNTPEIAKQMVCVMEGCPPNAIIKITESFQLIKVFAERLNGETIIRSANGIIKAVFGAGLKQPRKNSKTIILNNFTYSLNWI